MLRSIPARGPALLSSLAVLASLGACAKHDSETFGTTTIRSGTPEGPRVTNIPDDNAAPANDLAAAICRHERSCMARGANTAAGAAPRGEAACVTAVKPSAVLSLDALDCSPAVANAGLKDCLAALATDDCTATLSSDPVLIPACRPSAICAVGVAPSTTP